MAGMDAPGTSAGAVEAVEVPVEPCALMSCRITTAFQYIALQAEQELCPSREEPDWEDHMAKKLLKRQMRTKRQGSGRAVQREPSPIPSTSPDSPQRPVRATLPSRTFVQWDRQADVRIGPELASDSHAPIFCVLPTGKIYCNVQFSLLRSRDKVTYTWITPNGRRFYKKTLVKSLAQRRTWSWNYIDLSDERAQGLFGSWRVKVTVNGKRVMLATFHVLNDWIQVEKGLLPIILACPHGGRISPANCCKRSPSQGDDRGCTDTVEVVQVLKRHLTYMFGVSPTVITCKVHRRWLDVEVEEENAYQDEAMARYYNAYYECILHSIQHTLKLQRRNPLLLTLRAHHELHETVYASTLNGLTLMSMNERNEVGDPRFASEGLNARMAAGRYQLVPANQYQRDDKVFGAGLVVKTFGRDHAWRTDAMDLICPRTLCTGYGLRPLTVDIAESLGCMYTTFVHDDYCLPPSEPFCSGKARREKDDAHQE